jgi:hypothetical protein
MTRTVIILLLCYAFSGMAQISISKSDMPANNTPYRFSTSSPRPDLDFSATGANHTWDFSSLRNASQYVDTFKAVTAIGSPILQLFFASPFDANKATNALKMDVAALPTAISTMLPAGNNRIFRFFSDTLSHFAMVGYGIITDSQTAPIKYTTPDIIYKFPLSYGNSDSSNSGFTFPPGGITGIGFTFVMQQTRKNTVDGWGTLKTPFGTFPTLRVKSVVNQSGVYTPDTGSAQPVTVPLQYEYTWLAAGQGTPLLSTIITDNAGTMTIASITYRDSLRAIAVRHFAFAGAEEIAAFQACSDGFLVSVPQGNGSGTFVMYDLNGNCVMQMILPSGSSHIIPDKSIAPGTYLGKVQAGGSTLSNILYWK